MSFFYQWMKNSARQRLDVVAVSEPGREHKAGHLHHEIGYKILIETAFFAQVLDKEIHAELQQINLKTHGR